MILTGFDFRSTQGWLGTFWSIWPKMAFWVLQCSSRLRHVNLVVFTAPRKKVNIFGIFGVQHANQGKKNTISTLCFWVRVLGRICVCMLSACAHILKICVCIQLGCTYRPYVSTRILMPKNPNSNLFYFAYLFHLYNMPLPCLILCFWVSASMLFALIVLHMLDQGFIFQFCCFAMNMHMIWPCIDA